MRRRITRTFIAAAAAGVTATTLGLMVVSAASAATTAGAAGAKSNTSGGTPVYTPACSSFGGGNDEGACAGYVAKNRDFRYAQAVITVPTFDGNEYSPTRYIALASNFDDAGAGIMSCDVAHNLVSSFTCPGGTTYTAFDGTFHAGFFDYTHFLPVADVDPGDGVFFSVYDNAVGNQLQFTVTLPNGDSYYNTHPANGAIYTEAGALTDWSFSENSTPNQPHGNNIKDTSYYEGRFTTLSGVRGTFNGPWTLNAYEVSSNGDAPPFGTVIAAPTSLGTDNDSFNGLWGDTFSVYLWAH